MSEMTRREAMKLIGAAGLIGPVLPWTTNTAMGTVPRPVKFGVFADPHYSSFKYDDPTNYAVSYAKGLIAFVERMNEFQPDFVINLGDFVTPRERRYGNTPEQYAGFKEDLGIFWPILRAAPCPAYGVVGNHDVGWIRGGDEKVSTAELIAKGQTGGHALSKDEWCQILSMPGRYYAFDAGDFRCLVLDGNNAQDTDADNARDGLRGAYWIDQPQLEWIKRELVAHQDKFKLVFCHEELHHTDQLRGSGQGGWVPLPPHYKDGSYVGNGWQVRELFEKDRKVAAVFHGHYHKNRWTVYGSIHYITMENYPDQGENWAEVTVSSNRLQMVGHDKQVGFDLAMLPVDPTSIAPPQDIYAEAVRQRKEYHDKKRSGG